MNAWDALDDDTCLPACPVCLTPLENPEDQVAGVHFECAKEENAAYLAWVAENAPEALDEYEHGGEGG